jgi:predicted P-loop ATPase
LPINVGVTDLDGIERDRDQLWAEAIHLYRAGGVQWSGAYLLAKDEHAAFKSEDAWDEAVYSWLTGTPEMFEDGEEESPRWARRIKLQELMRKALQIHDKEMGTPGMKRVARILKRFGFEKTRARRGEGKSVWVASPGCLLNPQNSADDLV